MISKITSYHKYLGDPSKFVSRKEIYDLHGSCNKTWCNQVIHTGGVDSNGEYNHVFPWWDETLNCIVGNWYTTDVDGMLKVYNQLVTKEIIDDYKAQGWDITIPLSIEHDFPLTWKKDKLIEMFGQVNTCQSINGIKTLCTTDGVFYLSDTSYELWANDGTIGQLVVSEENFWLWNYMMHKQCHISIRCRKLMWCENISFNGFTLYHEMVGPSNEIGTSFSYDLAVNKIVLDNTYVKEFVDYVQLTVPHMKLMRTDYSKWPTTPITFERRRTDSRGHYLMYFTGWKEHDWKEMQLSWLESFLTSAPEYRDDLSEIVEYANIKWTIK